ncbi:MAG: 3-isopropylmalate dehydrogenase [Deltaproteobacteria bacterium ADurb.Bin510]|nr:MAG: 3-isopropylmalate dehydrogenase [Deltaproteobacteria bacterium ADurb.Bin510]
MILSTAMMLKYSFDRSADAQRIEDAVERVLAAGYRTADLPFGATRVVGTSEMTDLILKELA